MLLLLRFLRFLRFFENPKKRDFLRFFALLHTFSLTMDKVRYILFPSPLCRSCTAPVCISIISILLLDPETTQTGVQALQTLLLFFLGLLLILRLFHFTTERRQTSRTDW